MSKQTTLDNSLNIPMEQNNTVTGPFLAKIMQLNYIKWQVSTGTGKENDVLECTSQELKIYIQDPSLVGRQYLSDTCNCPLLINGK